MTTLAPRRVEDITLRGDGWEAYIDQNEAGEWFGHMVDGLHRFSVPFQTAATAFAWVEGAASMKPDEVVL